MLSHSDISNWQASFQDWFKTHGKGRTSPSLDKVINGLKEHGITTFAAVGYCFGGVLHLGGNHCSVVCSYPSEARSCVDLALENMVKSISLTHLSLMQVPADFDVLIAQSKASLHINSCEVDQQFPAEVQAKADEYFGNGKYAPGYKRDYWPGCTHGFAVYYVCCQRLYILLEPMCLQSDPKVKAGKEGAFKETVERFIKTL